MELHEIRYFLAVSRCLNFTRAADACHVTQPALTRAIQKMEDELGGLLFVRERGNTHLTELGRLIEPDLRAIVERTETVRTVAERFRRLDAAQMTLGVMSTIGPGRFMSVLNAFRASHPGVSLLLSEQSAAKLTEMLQGGALDVAVMAAAEGLPAGLQTLPLYDERFVVGCAASHRFARQEAVALHDLDGEVFLERQDCGFAAVIAARLAELGVRPVVSHRGEREDWILGMVTAGMGVCCLPEFTAALPGLVCRPLTAPPVSRQVCLVTVAGRRWSAPVAAFVRVVQGHPWCAAEAAA